MIKKLIISALLLFALISCGGRSLSKLGGPKYPSLNQSLTKIALKIKEVAPKNTILATLASTQQTDSNQNNQRLKKHVTDLADKLSIKIAEIATPKISVVERKSIETVLKELNLQSSAIFDSDQQVRIGKSLKANYLVIIEIFPKIRTLIDLNNEETKRREPFIKINLRIKFISIETKAIRWATETSYWQSIPRKIAEKIRERIRRNRNRSRRRPRRRIR